MRQEKDLSIEKQIERLQKQIVKFGDVKSHKSDPFCIKRQIIEDLKKEQKKD